MSAFRQIISADFRLIKRDGILMVGILAPIFLALFIRYLLPITEELVNTFSPLELTPYYPLILSVALLMVPSMLGMMAGFMLLDDRDEGMLKFYAITPLGKSGYIRYRMTATITLSFFLFFVVVHISDLMDLGVIYSLTLSMLYALEAPIFALLLAVFAKNKVEGLALNKVLSVTTIVPIVAYFLPKSFTWTMALIPTFWPAWALISYGTSDFLLLLITGYLIHLGILIYLVQLFIKRFC